MFHCLNDDGLYGPHIRVCRGISRLLWLRFAGIRRLSLLISPVWWRKIEKACVKIGGFQDISRFDKICNFGICLAFVCVNFESQRPRSS